MITFPPTSGQPSLQIYSNDLGIVTIITDMGNDGERHVVISPGRVEYVRDFLSAVLEGEEK